MKKLLIDVCILAAVLVAFVAGLGQIRSMTWKHTG